MRVRERFWGTKSRQKLRDLTPGKGEIGVVIKAIFHWLKCMLQNGQVCEFLEKVTERCSRCDLVGVEGEVLGYKVKAKTEGFDTGYRRNRGLH